MHARSSTDPKILNKAKKQTNHKTTCILDIIVLIIYNIFFFERLHSFKKADEPAKRIVLKEFFTL